MCVYIICVCILASQNQIVPPSKATNENLQMKNHLGLCMFFLRSTYTKGVLRHSEEAARDISFRKRISVSSSPVLRTSF